MLKTAAREKAIDYLCTTCSHKKSGTVLDKFGILFTAGRGIPGDRATVSAGVRGRQRSRLCRLLVAHLGHLLAFCLLSVNTKYKALSHGHTKGCEGY